MAKYRVTCDVEYATGTQTFIVVADSPEEAIKRFNSEGADEFESQEIEVQSLAKPELDSVELVDDSSPPAPAPGT